MKQTGTLAVIIPMRIVTGTLFRWRRNRASFESRFAQHVTKWSKSLENVSFKNQIITLNTICGQLTDYFWFERSRFLIQHSITELS